MYVILLKEFIHKNQICLVRIKIYIYVFCHINSIFVGTLIDVIFSDKCIKIFCKNF